MDDLIKDPPPPGAAKVVKDIIEGDDITLSRLRHRGGDDGIGLGGSELGLVILVDVEHGAPLSFFSGSTFRTGLCEKLIYIYHTCCLKSIVCGKIRV